MGALLMSILRVVNLLSWLLSAWEKFKARKEAEKQVSAAVAKKEAEVGQKADAIVAQPRTDDDTDQRLRDGRF